MAEQQFLNPSALMRAGREQMRIDAAAAAQPVQQPVAGAPAPEQPAVAKEERPWMEPPSTLRNNIDWQREAGGWFKPWAPFIVWAERKAPAILEGLEAAEHTLVQARKASMSGDSDIKVLNAQRAIARAYTQLEATYEASFKTRRR